MVLELQPMRVYAGTSQGAVLRGHLSTTEMRITTPRVVAAQERSPGAGAQVNYSVNVFDFFDASPAVAVSPSPGSTFPAGVSRVQVKARDALGIISMKSFLVIVERTP